MAQVSIGEPKVHTRYLFKSKLDGFFYLAVYFCLPLYSVVEGINHFDGIIFFTALSCCICVIYDCYSRYDESCTRAKVKKLYLIGILHGILAAYTVYGIRCYLSQIPLRCFWIYILLAVAPMIGIVDLAGMIRDDINARRY